MKFYAPKYKQLDLGLLRSSLDELDKTNLWVALGDLLPWTELEKEYNSRLDNQKKGAGNKPARMILGEMIIKHKLNLSDAVFLANIHQDFDNPKFSKVFLLYVSQIKGNDVMVIQCFISEDNHQIKPFYELKGPNNQGGREKREECKSSA